MTTREEISVQANITTANCQMTGNHKDTTPDPPILLTLQNRIRTKFGVRGFHTTSLLLDSSCNLPLGQMGPGLKSGWVHGSISNRRNTIVMGHGSGFVSDMGTGLNTQSAYSMKMEPNQM